MTPPPTLDRLLEDLEEALGAQGYLGLYEFSWTLNGYELEMSTESRRSLCAEAFQVLTERHDLTLCWTFWPALTDRRPVSPTIELDFDLDPDAPVTTPMLMLFGS